MASIAQYVSSANARIAKSFYDSFRKNHGRTRFVDKKRFSSEYKIKPDGNIEYKIILPSYTYYTNRGRASGVGSKNEGFYTSLLEWVRYKIEPDEKKSKGIAWAIKKKIEKDGTKRNYKKGNPPNTLQEPKQYAKEQIFALMKEEFRTRIKQYYQNEKLVIKL